jgi:2-polyprenyl-6-hydroxyphenyl methylase/3-demethylubiquinone-9 3-methyltransferase
MTDVQQYYETYWEPGVDVSDGDCTTPERKRRLLDTLGRYLVPGDRVLDLGCGAGKFTHWLQEAGFLATGMDLSPRAIDLARSMSPGTEFMTLDADGSIPVARGTFAAVWTTEVIEHVLDVHSFLAEINRVLQEDGLLVLTTPFHGLLKNLLVSVLKFDRHFDPESSHIRFFDRKGLERCLRRAGFEPIQFGGIGRFWKLYRTWFVVARKAQPPHARPEAH